MVYLYLGFFLFLLYTVAPLWLFLSAAAISLTAVFYSVTLRKYMKASLGKFSSRAVLALEPQKGKRRSNPSGAWVERRKFNRVAASLVVTYEVLEKEEKESPSASPDRPAADSILSLAKRYKTGKAIIRDISEGGLAIVGEDHFTVGEQLRLFVQLPEADKPIAILAEVCSCRTSFKLGENTYKAGLMILDLNLEDIVQLLDYLFALRAQ